MQKRSKTTKEGRILFLNLLIQKCGGLGAITPLKRVFEQLTSELLTYCCVSFGIVANILC